MAILLRSKVIAFHYTMKTRPAHTEFADPPRENCPERGRGFAIGHRAIRREAKEGLGELGPAAENAWAKRLGAFGKNGGLRYTFMIHFVLIHGNLQEVNQWKA